MYDVIVKIVWALSAVTLILTQTYAQSVSEDKCATGVHAIIARGQGGGDDLNVMSTLFRPDPRADPRLDNPRLTLRSRKHPN